MKNKLNIISLAVFLILLGSCSKNYLNLTNPNSPTSATPQLVLPTALAATAYTPLIGSVSLRLSLWMGYWAPSGSYALSSTDGSSYYESTNTGNSDWGVDYATLENYNYVELSATQQNLPFYAGAAKIMKALTFQHLVDMFNNVPYSQALLGTTVIQPKYDSSLSIYNSIVAQLDSGIALMQNPLATAVATSDIMFGGNATSWIQFANTLKLRILMRQSQVSSQNAFIQGELAKVVSNGKGFLTTDAAVNPGFANNAGQQNPVWGFFVGLNGLPTTGGASDYYRAAQYSISWLSTNNDPRLTYIYSHDGNSNTTYSGSILGAANNPGGNSTSSIGPGILKSVGQSAIVMSAAESYFLQAEAAFRGWIGTAAGAGALVNKGVQASFTYLGAGSATAYTSQPNVATNYSACTTPAQQLACIIRQKWIAMNGVTPFEAWCDYRRLGLPADIPLSVSSYVTTHAIPTRIIYPQVEYDYNKANVALQGNISAYSKVFWNQ